MVLVYQEMCIPNVECKLDQRKLMRHKKMDDSKRKKTIWYIVIFSILVNAVVWTGPLLGQGSDLMGPGFVIWGTAPLFISLLMRAITKDWSDLGIKPIFKKNAQWYIISFLAFPALMLLTLLISVTFSISSISHFSLGKFLPTFLIAIPVFFVFAIFEEVGWRGYLVPKLASLGINRYLSALLVGIIWATWHLPYIRQIAWVYNSGDFGTFLPRFYLAMILFSILYGEIRDITATFWPAVLMHCLGNAFGHPLSEYISLPIDKQYLGNVSTGLFMIAFVGLLGIIITQWRQRNLTQSSLSSLEK
jgi:membrane protease YdiL (CAAX protease family)